MAAHLKLKTGRTFTDESDITHNAPLFMIDRAVVLKTKVDKAFFLIDIWKDETTFNSSKTDATLRPIYESRIDVSNTNYTTYFLTSKSLGTKTVEKAVRTEVLTYILTEMPTVYLIDWDDWEQGT